MDRGTRGEDGGGESGTERTLLIQQIGQESVKFLIRAGGQKQPSGSHRADLTGTEGGGGSRGALEGGRFCRQKDFSSARRSAKF